MKKGKTRVLKKLQEEIKFKVKFQENICKFDFENRKHSENCVDTEHEQLSPEIKK